MASSDFDLFVSLLSLADQNKILKEIQTYYSNLLKSRNIDETPISSIIKDKNIRKLDNTSKQLEGKLTAEEISFAIKI